MKNDRLEYIDNIRILLATLVILHHAAVTYGGPGGWIYVESTPDIFSYVVLALFVAVNQAFFMGFFFLIAGYFTLASYNRNGCGGFLKNRLLRLGVPLLLYIAVIDPVVVYSYKVLIKGFGGGFLEFVRQYLKGYRGLHVGPMWFVQTLLVFSVGYVLVRLLVRSDDVGRREYNRKPTTSTIMIFVLILGLVTFAVRIWYPVMYFTEWLNIQFAHFSQYLALFVIGIVAYKRSWLSDIALSTGMLWFGIVLFFVLVIFPILFIFGGALKGNIQPYLQGLHWQSLAYAIWEQFVGIGMIIGILSLFYHRFNSQRKLAEAASAASYTAYIIHPPVLVILAGLIKNVQLHPLLKFTLVGFVGVLVSFAFGNIIRKMPLARRIL